MLKKFLVGTVVALALLVGVTASAADFGTTTLKVGSKGEAVKAVQTLVGATPVDGIFGKMTAAKVKVWQAANGLTADGVFGPASKAKAGAAVGTVALCPNGMTLASNCTAAPSTGTTTTTPTTGALVGGAGDINVTKTSTDVESEALTGSTTKVLGFKVEATDSDAALTNVKVSFENIGTGDASTRLNRYADTVSIYMGSTKVGSADVADFTKTGNVYSKSIALSNAIVREGSTKKATFWVEVKALSSIETTDAESDKWVVTLDNVRFQDATGVVTTISPDVDEDFNFIELSDSGDVKATVSKGSATPAEGNVEISKNGSTNVLMLEFKVKAAGTDVSFDKVNVTLDGTLNGDALKDVVNELTLKSGSDEIASISSFNTLTDASTDSGTQTYAFNLDDTYTVDQDSTATFRVYANVNDGDSISGDSLQVSVPTDAINAEDVNGDSIDTTGSATGNDQTFFSESISASNFTSTYTEVMSDTDVKTVTYNMTFKVTAFGNDFYIPKDGLSATVTGATPASVTLSDLSATNASDDEAGLWLVNDGETATFTVSGVVVNPGTGFHKVQLGTLEYGTTTAASATPFDFNPDTSFQTQSVYFTHIIGA